MNVWSVLLVVAVCLYCVGSIVYKGIDLFYLTPRRVNRDLKQVNSDLDDMKNRLDVIETSLRGE